VCKPDSENHGKKVKTFLSEQLRMLRGALAIFLACLFAQRSGSLKCDNAHLPLTKKKVRENSSSLP